MNKIRPIDYIHKSCEMFQQLGFFLPTMMMMDMSAGIFDV